MNVKTRSKLIGFNVVTKDGSIIRKFRSKTKQDVMKTIIKCYGWDCNVRDFHQTFIDVDRLVLVYKDVIDNPYNPNSFHARKAKRIKEKNHGTNSINITDNSIHNCSNWNDIIMDY